MQIYDNIDKVNNAFQRGEKSVIVNICKTTVPEKNIHQVLLHTIVTDMLYFFLLGFT
jgi:hypothetical protein